MRLHRLIMYLCTVHRSRTLNGSPVLQHFEHSNAVEIRMFDFYQGVSHIQRFQLSGHGLVSQISKGTLHQN